MRGRGEGAEAGGEKGGGNKGGREEYTGRLRKLHYYIEISFCIAMESFQVQF